MVPADFVMSRQMLRGLKRRAERRGGAPADGLRVVQDEAAAVP
jgi:hypothetical protein